MGAVRGNDLVAQALVNEGVDTAFFLTGGPIVDVARVALDKGINCVDTRHEQAASMAAHAYARVLGKPGVCFAASGPGVTNLVTGIGNAYLDAAPVVTLGGASAMSQDGMGAFQEMDQTAMFRPITKWAERVKDTRRIPEYINKAFRMARGGQPGPVYLDLPGDVLYKKVEEDDVFYPKKPHEVSRTAADPELVRRAIELLSKAERPVVISGSGVLWSQAMEELKTFVELAGIPFYTTPQGRGVIVEDHPMSFLAARRRAWREADVVVIIGTRVNFVIGFGLPPRFSSDAKMIQIDISDEEIGRNRPADIGLVGDARTVLRQLIDVGQDVLSSAKTKAWTDVLAEQDKAGREKSEAFVHSNSAPIHPLRLCKEVRDFMDRDAVLVVDGHEILNFARQSIPTHCAGHRINAGANGCMGVAVPFGRGAKVAKPNTQCIVLSGDGSFGMNGMELCTMVRHGIPAIIVISNNGGWAAEGGMTARELGFTRYEQMAEMFGAHGEYVENAGDIRPALERAAASGKPAVVNVITDSAARATTQSFSAYRAV